MSLAVRERTPVRADVVEILAEVFQYDGAVTPATGPDEIERWDSLEHIALVRVIEQTFGISLTMDEMMEMRTAGDIEAVLARHSV